MRPPPRRPSGSSPLSWLLILGVLGLVLVLPLLGAWVASTLLIDHGASQRWAAAAGLALCLGLPLAWEVLSLPQRQPGGARPKRWLRLRTRLLLRTWALNLVFLTAALLISPRGVFTALSTRGDWMLPVTGGPHVEVARRMLFAAADGVEWAYVLATDNPYRDQLIAIAPRPPLPRVPLQPALPKPSALQPPSPVPPPPTDTAQKDPLRDSDADVVLTWKTEPHPSEPDPVPSPVHVQPKAAEGQVVSTKWQGVAPKAPPESGKTGGAASYPLPAQLHPRVTSVPRELETDLVSVAKYLVEGERDPFQRIKVLHDYVADRVVYDAVAYRTHKIPPQPPEDVFQKRMGVCAGYANLFAAMGKAAGEDIVTISGEAIKPSGEKQLESHAWNAVSIEGKWYLVDVTWDAGYVSGDVFSRAYTTKYLFIPPQEFLRDHLPEEPGWQLLDAPLARGEVLRQALGHAEAPSTPGPRTEPSADEKPEWQGISILQPSRPRAEVRGRFNVELDNPKGLPAQVSILNTQDGSQEPCSPQYGGASYACTVMSRGLYRIQVFAGPQTPPKLMAQLEVTGM